MAFATICLIIATFIWLIAALLVVADEPDLVGLDAFGWAILGLPFFALGHWLPGHTRAVS